MNQTLSHNPVKVAVTAAYQGLYAELLRLLPAGRLLADPISLLAHAGDASFYRLIPKLIAKAANEAEVSTIVSACARHGLPVTFRAAGTSLSGQAQSESVLLQIMRGFNQATVVDEGRRIRMQPALLGAAANRMLARYGRKIGPDPASLEAAMLGGIAANNASGMCCGVSQNAYHTLDSLRAVFADGSGLDTSDAESRQAFAITHPDLLAGLSALAEEAQADAGLRDLITRKYRLKNTMGYGLNALIDFQDPFEVLQHLLIGSEGTLAFISEITLHTVPDPQFKCAWLAFFADMPALGRAVQALSRLPVSAVECLDAAALDAVARHPLLSARLREHRGQPALLIDLRAESERELRQGRAAVEAGLQTWRTQGEALAVAEPHDYQDLWSIRKGLFPAIGGMRPAGTTVIIEDVAFPLDRLGDALSDLRALLDRNGYGKAIIYGHALSGNLHFVFWQDFSDPAAIGRYALLMEGLAGLVLDRYQGSLKAEHGTGRNMAPFLEREWGPQAYALMRRIKNLFDPEGLLNPGVLLSSDPRLHLKHLKPSPAAHPLIDACTECGFCENVCPSREVSFTPRQRIAVWREISAGDPRRDGPERSGENVAGRSRPGAEGLRRAFSVPGEKTCATDGLCAGKCPVGIDTGSFIKELRRSLRSPWQRRLAFFIAGRFKFVLAGVRMGLGLLQILRSGFGDAAVNRALRRSAEFLPGLIPRGLLHLPPPGRSIQDAAARLAASPGTHSGFDTAGSFRRTILYVPSCINRMFGPERKGDLPLPEVMISLFQQAGFAVRIPEQADGLCCGLAFASKGFPEAARWKRDEMAKVLARASGDCMAIVCDTSPCSQRMIQEIGEQAGIPIYDSVAFLAEHVLSALRLRARRPVIALHAACSLAKMGAADQLRKLAEACAERVILPEGVACCGVAGDRIFLQPELPMGACAPLRGQLPESCREGFSSSRTCEIGLSRASGIGYRSIAYLLRESCLPGNLQVSVTREERLPEPVSIASVSKIPSAT